MRIFKIDDEIGNELEIFVEKHAPRENICLAFQIIDSEGNECTIYLNKCEVGFIIEELKRHY